MRGKGLAVGTVVWYYHKKSFERRHAPGARIYPGPASRGPYHPAPGPASAVQPQRINKINLIIP